MQVKESDHIDTEIFFRMDKDIVMDLHWAILPLASKAIYLAICIHCNKKGVAFPSQTTIARLTHCTEKTVSSGIKGLFGIAGLPGHNAVKHVTRRGKLGYKYFIPPLPPQHKNAIWFYRSFIDNGNWQNITNSAKALYITILAFSFFDYDLYVETQYEEYEAEVAAEIEFFYDDFKQREYDFADPDLSILAEYSGLHLDTVKTSLSQLHNEGFIDISQECWKVFKSPPSEA